MSNPIYKDLPPVERKRDGSLYRMTPAQHKQAKSLLRRECCSYDDGNCLEQEDGDAHTCTQCISCSVCCKWFRYAVLPQLGTLEAEIFKDKDTKRCVICGQAFVPLTEDNRLCAKEIIGNRKNLTKWQDDFFAYMVEKYPDLERGESASKTGRKHIPTRLFKQAVNLSKEARQIEKVLDEIGTFNSSKKKAEALALLKKWFPQMENFSGQLKKYQVTIDDLLAENTKLEERAKASEKGKMSNTIERAKLESELNELQRVVDRIPPDVLAQLKQEAKHHHRSR